MDTHICMAESLCCPPEITTPLSAIIQYKLKKLKKKKKEVASRIHRAVFSQVYFPS